MQGSVDDEATATRNRTVVSDQRRRTASRIPRPLRCRRLAHRPRTARPWSDPAAVRPFRPGTKLRSGPPRRGLSGPSLPVVPCRDAGRASFRSRREPTASGCEADACPPTARPPSRGRRRTRPVPAVPTTAVDRWQPADSPPCPRTPIGKRRRRCNPVRRRSTMTTLHRRRPVGWSPWPRRHRRRRAAAAMSSTDERCDGPPAG